MLHMTPQEYNDFLRRTGKLPTDSVIENTIRQAEDSTQALEQLLAPQQTSKPRKYRNKKVYVYEDGFVTNEKTDAHGALKEHFDSVKEYERCLQLRMMEKAGVIADLNTQETLIIQEAFRDKGGKHHRAITYRADFTYVENGVKVVEDVKAYSARTKKYRTTETFNIKWKLLQAKYPDCVFRLF